MQSQLLLFLIPLLGIIIYWIGINRKIKILAVLGDVLFLFVYLLPFFPQPRFYDFFIWQISGIVVLILGIGIFLWAFLQFRKESISPYDQTQKLITTGPYKFLRHPQYLGGIFAYYGLCWITKAVYSFYLGLLVIAAVWILAYLEERLILQKIHKETFLEYKKSTGMFWLK